MAKLGTEGGVSDEPLKVGDRIPPQDDMLVIDHDIENKQVLVEFVYKGRTCRCWLPEHHVEAIMEN